MKRARANTFTFHMFLRFLGLSCKQNMLCRGDLGWCPVVASIHEISSEKGVRFLLTCVMRVCAKTRERAKMRARAKTLVSCLSWFHMFRVFCAFSCE